MGSAMEYENIPDRGPTDHFHGRKTIIKNFISALKHHLRKNDGTTFLIQGPPGAGKTALLHKLAEVASSEWNAVDIDPEALWDADWLMHALGRGRELQLTEVSGGVSLGGVLSAEGTRAPVPENPISLIAQVDTPPLLLILDEAQTLGGVNKPEGKDASVAANFIKSIHNGKIGKPVMLLAAGLGTTAKAFADLGISRFMSRGHKYKIGLGSLGRDSTCATLCDLIQEYGRVADLPSSWIEQIADRTHGWPQHIMSYADQAAEYLHEHRIPSDDGLEVVLQWGRAKQVEYYRERAEDIAKENRQILADFFAGIPQGKTTLERDIKSALMQVHTEEKADELFDTMLQKGIIDQREDGSYGVPIPSMHTWLVEEYAKEKLIQKPKLLPPPPSQT